MQETQSEYFPLTFQGIDFICKIMIEGLQVIKPKVHKDERGFFLEMYQKSRYNGIGVAIDFLQDNHSYSVKSVIRGMHFQKGQAKLVTCAKGKILDVAVDIRPQSPTFGQYEMVYLTEDNHFQFFIPDGFAHGFCVLSDGANVIYKVSSLYDSLLEGGFRYDDPDVAISWPIQNPILSARDQNAPYLRQLDL